MSDLEEIQVENRAVYVKILRTFLDYYPIVDWNIWKQQVIVNRKTLNPFKKVGLIWFHIPSVIAFFHTSSYETYKWINPHHPFFKHNMSKKVFVIQNITSRQVRGIRPEALGIKL